MTKAGRDAGMFSQRNTRSASKRKAARSQEHLNNIFKDSLVEYFQHIFEVLQDVSDK